MLYEQRGLQERMREIEADDRRLSCAREREYSKLASELDAVDARLLDIEGQSLKAAGAAQWQIKLSKRPDALVEAMQRVLAGFLKRGHPNPPSAGEMLDALREEGPPDVQVQGRQAVYRNGLGDEKKADADAIRARIRRLTVE